MFRYRPARALLALSVLAIPQIAWGADEASANAGNTAWILTATALVLFMTLPGLALFYAGLVRQKNVQSIFKQCFGIAAIVSLVWMFFGYTMAFGESVNGFVGNMGKAFFSAVGVDTLAGDIPESLFAMFQLTFAIITPALVIGAFAERVRFSAVLLFTVLWSAVVYSPVTHWVWGEGGWLLNKGLIDFAGGTVVHITAGTAGLLCAILVGRRIGFGKADMSPSNEVMVAIGAGMLWIGWFGFNGGSALAAGGAAAMAMLVTHISAACAALSWAFCEKASNGRASLAGISCGVVAGLVCATPGAGVLGPGGAMVLGLISGAACFKASVMVKEKFNIDDSLDVFAVHGVGGILGTLGAGIFAATTLGVFSGQGFADGITSIGGQLGVQGLGVLATIGYTAICTLVIVKIVDGTVGFRVSAEEEEAGLDMDPAEIAQGSGQQQDDRELVHS